MSDAYDVVVVGGGLGGLSAACRAAQLGLRPVVLERGTDAQYLCNSRFSGGILHIAQHNVTDPAERLVSVIEQATLGQADPDLARALAEDARRAVEWLRAEGAKFIRVGQIVWQQHVLAPPRPITPGLDWKGRGPDVTLRTLEANLVKRGANVLRGAAVHALMERDGRCVGVEAQQGDRALEFAAKAVVLADGGYQANLELLGEHISPAPQKLMQRGAATGVGDGLRMAKTMGGAVTRLDAFYGHMLSRDPFTNDKVWPYPQLDELGTAGIVIDAHGERFADEGMGGVYVANMIARLQDPLSTWAVFDDAVWNGPGKGARIPANPNLVKAGGTVHQAPTLAVLAEIIGVPVERFALTVGAYNEALAAGQLENLVAAPIVHAHPGAADQQAALLRRAAVRRDHLHDGRDRHRSGWSGAARGRRNARWPVRGRRDDRRTGRRNGGRLRRRVDQGGHLRHTRRGAHRAAVEGVSATRAFFFAHHARRPAIGRAVPAVCSAPMGRPMRSTRAAITRTAK